MTSPKDSSLLASPPPSLVPSEASEPQLPSSPSPVTESVQGSAEPPLPPDPEKPAQGCVAISSQAEKAGGELRCYYLSSVTLVNEAELLALEGEESLIKLLERVVDRLCVTVTLMEAVNQEQPLPDNFLPLLGQHLRHDLTILERAAGVLAQMKLTQVSVVL